jgi:hypothetical protein
MLLNPKNPKQKVASSKISGLWGVEKFHGHFIPKFCVKVNVMVVHVDDVPFMHPHELADQVLMQDVVGYLVELEICEGRTELKRFY